MVELADTLDLGSSEFISCGFDSHYLHSVKRYFHGHGFHRADNILQCAALHT